MEIFATQFCTSFDVFSRLQRRFMGVIACLVLSACGSKVSDLNKFVPDAPVIELPAPPSSSSGSATITFSPNSMTIAEGGTGSLNLGCTSSTTAGTPTFSVGLQSPLVGGVSQVDCSIGASGDTLECRPKYRTGHATWTGWAQVLCTIGDPDSGATATKTVSLTITDTNRPPSIDLAIPDETFTNGLGSISTDLDLNYTDPDGDTVSFSCAWGAVAGGPYGNSCGTFPGTVSLNTSTGAFSYNPPATGTGSATYYVRIRSNDNYSGGALTTDDVFAVTLKYPPIVSGVSPTGGSVLGGSTLTVTGSGFDIVTGAEVYIGTGGTYTTLCPRIGMNTSTQIQCALPAMSAGLYGIRVVNPDSLYGTLANSFTYSAAPTIVSVTPNKGATAGGTTVTITGTNFVYDADQSLGTRPKIGSTFCSSFTVVSGTTITCVTPNGGVKSTVDVSVVNLDGQTATLTNGYSYRNKPTLSAVAPASGPKTGGSSITLTGTDLENVTGVSIGTAPCSIVSASTTSLTCITDPAPGGASGSYSIVATGDDGQVSLPNLSFTYSALAGSVLAFTTQPPGSIVAGNAFSPIVEIRDSNGNVISGASEDDASAVISLGVTGAAATLLGTVSKTAVSGVANFTGNNLKINTAGTYTLTATKPDLSVAPNNGTPSSSVVSSSITILPDSLSASTSTFTAPKSIIGVGENMTLTISLKDQYGNGITSASSVSVAQTGGTGSATIGAATPLGSGVYSVVVTGTGTGSLTFTATADATPITTQVSADVRNAPVVTSVSPSVGPRVSTTPVTITGTGFDVAGATVTVGGQACTSVIVVSSTTITCTVPTSVTSGAVAVIVTNTADNLSFTLGSGFTYQDAPTLTSVSPSSGTVCGGTTLTLTGTNFRSGMTISVGGLYSCTLVSVSSTSATCSTAQGAVGTNYSVTVTNTDTQAATLANSYSYTASPAATVSFNPQPPASVSAGQTFNTSVRLLASDGSPACVTPDGDALVRLRVTSDAASLYTVSVPTGTAEVVRQASSGIATFPTGAVGLSFLASGTYTLRATKDDTSVVAGGSAGLAAATSSSITVTPAALSVADSTFTTSNTTVAVARNRTLSINLKDAYGNPYTDLATVAVTKVSGAGTGTIGAAVATATAGLYTVTFTGTGEGSLVLKATVNGQDLSSQITLNVVQVLQFTVVDYLPPLTSTYPPLVQGVSSTITPSAVAEFDGNSYSFTCTYETPAMGSSDPNYVSSATACGSLPGYATSNSVNYAFNGSGAAQYATFNASTGALTWRPHWNQRGVFKINLTMVSGDVANGSRTQSYYLAVREPWASTDLAVAMDGGMSTGFTGYTGIPFAPQAIQSANSKTNWLNLATNTIAGLFTNFASTTSVWQGTGAASTSSVSPYSLNFQGDGTKIDALAIDSTVYDSSTAKTYISVWARTSDHTQTNRIIASNRGGTAGYRSGVTIRQSATSAGKLQLVSEPISFVTEAAASAPQNWWRFEETAGSTTFADSGSAGVSMASSGTVTAGVTGALINEASLGIQPIAGQTTNYVSTPDSDALDLASGSWTIELVGRTAAVSGFTSYLHKRNSAMTTAGWQLNLNWLAAAPAFLANGLSGTVVLQPSATAANYFVGGSVPNYFALTYNSATQALTMYVNPTSTTGNASVVWANSIVANSNPLFFGQNNAGVLDELIIYTRALTGAEVLAHSNAARGGGCNSSSNWTSNLWSQIAAVLTGSSLSLYVNGRLECSTSTIAGFNPNTGAPFTLGNYPTASAGAANATNFNGRITDFRVYNQSAATSTTSVTQVVSDFLFSGNRHREIPIPNIVADSSLVFFWDAANSDSGVRRQTAVANGTVVSAFDLGFGNTYNMTFSGSFAGTATSGWIGPGTGFSTTGPYALRFDNVDDNVNLAANSLNPAALNHDPNSSFTISAWAQLNNPTAGQGTIFSLGAAGCCGLNGIALFLRNAALTAPIAVHVGYGSNGLKVGYIDSTLGAVLDGAWHHVSVTYNGLTKFMNFYIDGNIATPASNTAGAVVSGSNLDLSSITTAGGSLSAFPLNIGRFLSSSNPLNSALSALALYNRALTQSEVRQNCIAMRHRFPTGAGTPTCATP